MRHGRDTLHLDRVHLLEGVVEDSGGINDLPPHVTVVEVSNEEGLGGERVWLDIDIRAGNLVDEGRLADVWVPADEERARGRVDRGQAGEVLPDLLQELERLVLPLHDRRHPAEGGSLELLASVKRVAEFEQPDVVLRDLIDEMARGAELAEREFVVVLVVKDIAEGG